MVSVIGGIIATSGTDDLAEEIVRVDGEFTGRGVVQGDGLEGDGGEVVVYEAVEIGEGWRGEGGRREGGREGDVG